MRILFAITVLCVLILLWAGIAIRRHVLNTARKREASLERIRIAAALEVELKNQLRNAHTESGFFGSVSDPQPARHGSRTRPTVRDSALRAAALGPVTVAYPAASTSQPKESTATEPEQPVAESTAADSVQDEHRKPPVSINSGRFERLDLAHFNKDMGDLSDPYQIPRATARNRS